VTIPSESLKKKRPVPAFFASCDIEERQVRVARITMAAGPGILVEIENLD